MVISYHTNNLAEDTTASWFKVNLQTTLKWFLSSSIFLLMIICMHLILQKEANLPFHLLGSIHYIIHGYACFVFFVIISCTVFWGIESCIGDLKLLLLEPFNCSCYVPFRIILGLSMIIMLSSQFWVVYLFFISFVLIFIGVLFSCI
jgi:hypothetical protein